MVSHRISDEGGEGGEKNQSKSSPSTPLNALVGSEAGRSCKMATEALPVRELSASCARGPGKLFLNNVINHSNGSLSLPHKESKHTNNYTL